jgi:hypothetical protein
MAAVGLSIKVACFAKSRKGLHYQKQLNCTEPSPSVTVPCYNVLKPANHILGCQNVANFKRTGLLRFHKVGHLSFVRRPFKIMSWHGTYEVFC